ncbi:hypothetical protein KEM55_001881, partial [Ascosphaera atra]
MQAYYKIFNALIQYVQNNFQGGLTWNNKDGIETLEALKQVKSPSTSPKSGPPPPSGPAPP